ncbi:c-type cytochrome [Paraliomyxa miuraensis]|uniref:c-type cytochrome n=1 Tax=Paraliomyxa miuraensis TaxID=376150 RepID=UPI0022541A6C|nr:cytochrome c [Paraliomyxa miuraensis]MCX4241063.1 cytochrome c [Paraliomyxa miuraensis]
MCSRRAVALLALWLAGGCTQPAGPERPISGKQLYEQYCARCHGEAGIPTKDAPTASSLADAAFVERLSDEGIKGVIRAGRGQMPGFGDRFTDATLQVLVAHVRSLPGQAAEAPPPAP